jgi:hypothetical protein
MERSDTVTLGTLDHFSHFSSLLALSILKRIAIRPRRSIGRKISILSLDFFDDRDG